MTTEEAKSFLINISYQLGNMGIEYLSEKDGEKMREAIKALEQQTNKGKWIRSWCEWQQYLECSKCGYETGLRCDTNFCPNCGADMTESED